MVRLEIPTPENSADLSDFGGAITARWTSTEEEDERTLATIVLDLDLSGSFDLTDELEDEAADRRADESWDSADLERSLAGEVTVVWDLTHDLPASVSGELTGTGRVACAWTVNAGSFELPVEFDRESTERITFEASYTLE